MRVCCALIGVLLRALTVSSNSSSNSPARVGLRSDQAYLQLKEALIAGDYKAGERLQLESIALANGSSRQPVMDAVRRLESEGLLTIVPQVGTIVRTIDTNQVRDFFEFLARTEGYFCELAAQRGTADERRELVAIVDRYRKEKLAKRSPREIARRYRVHNREFHGLIHQMARSPLLHQTAVGLWDRADFYINTLSTQEPFVQRENDAVREHKEIAEAIAAKDSTAASKAVVPHILTFADVVGLKPT